MRQTLVTKILNHILMLLGFAGTASCEYINQACEYGMPTMDFEVSGKVVNEEAAPVKGIQVSCSIIKEPGIETVLTAEDGSFTIAGTSVNARLEFEDIDGPENGGEFESMYQDISVEKVKEGDGKWYMGEFEAKDVVIKMKEKE